MHTRTLHIGIALSLWFMLSAGLSADTFRLNYQQADLRLFINQVADITGRTIIVDPRVRGQVTVMADAELTAEEVYEVFLAVLSIQGFAVVGRDEQQLQIIPASEARQTTGPVITEALPNTRDFVTRIMTLTHTSAAELLPILRPLGAAYGHLSVIPSANALLMVDHADNMIRFEQILSLLDVPSEATIQVFNLEHAWVTDIVVLLEALMPTQLVLAEGEGLGRSTLRLVADERSNRLIGRGHPDILSFVQSLLLDLDVPATARRGSTEVVFLENGDAGTMAELLRGLSPQATENPANGTLVSVAILADEELNALIIRAGQDDMAELIRLISKLDIPRAQVLIEAAIVEVSGSLSEQFGLQSGLLQEGSDTAPALLTSNVDERTAGAVLGGGLPLGLLGDSGLFAGGIFTQGNVSFAAIIRALEQQSNTNLLSTPYVMTMDNMEARLVVGETIPFRRSDPTEDNPFTITREDVATEIRVRPNIQQNDMIRLAINQRTEELIGSATLESRTSKREIDTNVLVANGETIILGGMVKDQIIETQRKVPLLGDLPFIGALFRSTSTRHEKVNLLVVIRPSIARERTTDQARERFLGIWDLRFGPEGSALEAVIEPPTFDQLYRGIQWQEITQ